MSWNGPSDCSVVIDLEEATWLKSPRAFEPISSNTRHDHCLCMRKTGKDSVQLNCCLHMVALKLMENIFFPRAD